MHILDDYIAANFGAGFLPASYESNIFKTGAANNGITIWQAKGQNRKIFTFIEKLSHSEGEKIFHDSLESFATHRGHKWVPEYLRVEKIDDATFQVMQIYAGPSHLTQLTVPQAQYLGQCIASMSLFPIVDGGEWGRKRITIDLKLIDKFESLLISVPDNDLQKKLINNIKILKNNLNLYNDISKKLTLTWANNDIKWDHIFECSNKQIQIIDWGMLAPNYIGADLHHFYTEAKMSEDFSIYGILFEAYSRELSCILDDEPSLFNIELGIVSFALRQHMLWSISCPTNLYFFKAADISLLNLIELISS